MRPSSLINHGDYGVQQIETFSQWDDASQYVPTLGNFYRSPDSTSDISCTNTDPLPLINYGYPYQTAWLTDSLPLLQFGDWEEGRTYDEDPPTCILYLLEWKVTLNNRMGTKDI